MQQAIRMTDCFLTPPPIIYLLCLRVVFDAHITLHASARKFTCLPKRKKIAIIAPKTAVKKTEGEKLDLGDQDSMKVFSRVCTLP